MLSCLCVVSGGGRQAVRGAAGGGCGLHRWLHSLHPLLAARRLQLEESGYSEITVT